MWAGKILAFEAGKSVRLISLPSDKGLSFDAYLTLLHESDDNCSYDGEKSHSNFTISENEIHDQISNFSEEDINNENPLQQVIGSSQKVNIISLDENQKKMLDESDVISERYALRNVLKEKTGHAAYTKKI